MVRHSRGALTSKTTTEWLAIFRAADIAAMPCHTLETLRGDPQLEAVGLVSLEEHPVEGTTAAIRSSISFDRSYPSMRAPSQPRGWETRSILQEMGYPPSEIDALLSTGAALEHRPHG